MNMTLICTFARGGLACSTVSFVITERSVLRMNICAQKPANRKYGDIVNIRLIEKNEQ